MNELVHIFINMTQAGIQAGAAALAVLLLRRLFGRKQPINFCCVLWMLVFLRFLCPVTWNVELPFYEEKARAADISERVRLLEEDAAGPDAADLAADALAVVPDSEEAPGAAGAVVPDSEKTPGTAGSVVPDVGKAQDIAGAVGQSAGKQAAAADAAGPALPNIAGSEIGRAAAAENAAGQAEAIGAAAQISAWFSKPANRWLLLQGIALIWLGGAAGLLVLSVVRYWSLKRRLRFAVKCEFSGQEIWETDQIADPFVLGIFRPGIYLPAGLAGKEKYHIVIHERAHLARRDYLMKPVCYLGVIAQWMNPFAWIAFYFYNQDMEMACDERALRDLGRGERLDYSRTLLMTAARGSGLRLPVFFGESNAKRRVENILQRKKKTLAGGMAAAAFVCALAVLLFIRIGGESGSPAGMGAAEGAEEGGQTGDGTDDDTQAGDGTGGDAQTGDGAGGGAPADDAGAAGPEAGAKAGQYAAGGIEACPFADNGELKVMFYNFTGWDHMYVNQADFRVERQKENGWEEVEPDRPINRISSQPALLQMRWPRELGGLLAQYEDILEDGEYRLVFYCQDTPVEDPQLKTEEVYAAFSWKDGAPKDEAAMLERMDEAQERYAAADFPWKVIFSYDGEPSSKEEEIQRRAEENEAVRAGDEALLKLYREKLDEIEARMEKAGAEQKEAYSDFCTVLQGEMAGIEWSMNNLEDIWIDGENVTQKRLEYEDLIGEREEELSSLEDFIAAREALQNALLEEIAKTEEKQEKIDYYNQKAEFLQQLMERRYQLQELLQMLNQEAAKCRIQEQIGYDLVKEQTEKLAFVTSKLKENAGGERMVPMILPEGDNSEVRDCLYQFWLETEGTGKLPETFSAAELEEAAVTLAEEKPKSETVYRTVKSMSFTFGEETEDGGLIVTSITAWGNGYLILVDRSGDIRKDDAEEETTAYCYDRLYWLAAPEGGMEAVIASDEPGLTYERFMESLLSSTWDGRAADRVAVAMF